MNPTNSFFTGSTTSFGIFYPTEYVVIGFDSGNSAKIAFASILNAGYQIDEARIFEGTDVLSQLAEIKNNLSMWERLKQWFATSIGEEAHFLDQDIAHAESGGAFIAIYSPDDRETYRLQRMMLRFHPLFMRRYLKLGIQRLDPPKPEDSQANSRPTP